MGAGETFSFEIPIKNYDDLRANTQAPRLLVILEMPSDSGQWLLHNEDGLISRKCAYWCNLKGMPDTENLQSKTVIVSRLNLFSPESLRTLMIKASRVEDLGDGL